MDPLQTTDERRGASTGADAVRPEALKRSRIRSRMRWGQRRSSTIASVPTNLSGRSGVRRLQTLLGRVRHDSLLRNSLFIMLTTIVNSAFGFVFWLLAARLFTARDVGLTAAIVSASTIVVILASIGVGGMLIQSLPKQEEPSEWSLTIWAGMATAIGTGLALGCGALVLLPFISKELTAFHGASYATVFVVGTVAVTAGSIVDSVFIAARVAGNMFVRNSVVAAGKVLMIVLVTVLAGTRALNLLGAWAAASVVGFGLGIGVLARRMNLPWPPRISVLARTALGLRSRLAGNQLIGIGAALLPYLLPLLVTARLSLTENAYFYTTWMLGGIFLIIAPAVSQSLFAEGVHNPEELHLKARSALGFIALILTPFVVGVFAMGGILLSAFGSAYEHHAIGLLRIVLLASIPDAIMNVYISVLRVQGRLITAAGLSLGIGLGIVALSWTLLPVLGINAVGWAFLAMQTCGCIFMVLDLLRSSSLARAAAFLRYKEPA
jgi:O-antigen/teichoic acid export membrane protein